MRFTRVWIFPIPVLKSWDGWGHTKGPVIYMPPNGSDRLLEHEKFHIKQWLALFAVHYLTVLATIIAVIWFGPVEWTLGMVAASILTYLPAIWYWNEYRYRIEAAAYGEGVRLGGDIRRYALAMADYDAFTITANDAEKLIAQYRDSGKLF